MMRVRLPLPLALVLLGAPAPPTNVSAAAYEKPRAVPAAGVVPQDLLRGAFHEVQPQVRLTGTARLAVANTASGQRELNGIPELRRAIVEAAAIDALSRRGAVQAAGTGVADAGMSRWNFLTSLVKRPGTTMKEMGSGASQLVDRTQEGFKGGKSRLEDSAATNLLGASRKKRLTAARLGVDPYSDNPDLQRELSRIGWSETVGSTGASIGVGAILPPGVDSAMSAVGISEQVQRAVTESSPTDLRIFNRDKLRVANIEGEKADVILAHDWLSPTHETILCQALAALGARCDSTALLRYAENSRNARQANSLCRIASMLTAHVKDGKQPERLFRAGDMILAVEADRSATAFADWDYALWTKSNAQLVTQIANAARRRGDKPPALHLSGEASDAFLAGCRQRGWKVSTDALAR